MPPKKKTAPKPKPKATLNNADWKSSDAKKLMAQDVIDGLIPLTGHVDVREMYDSLYKDHPLFKNFPFVQDR